MKFPFAAVLKSTVPRDQGKEEATPPAISVGWASNAKLGKTVALQTREQFIHPEKATML